MAFVLFSASVGSPGFVLGETRLPVIYDLLTDFGLQNAALFLAGVSLGGTATTPGFAFPESCRGKSLYATAVIADLANWRFSSPSDAFEIVVR